VALVFIAEVMLSLRCNLLESRNSCSMVRTASAYLECWKCPNWRAPNGFGAGNPAATSGRFQRELTMNNRSLQQANPTDPGETRGHPNVLPMDATLEIGGEKFSVERGLFDMLPNHRNNPRDKTTSLPPLSDIARLSLSIGRLLMESGESGRIIHEEIIRVAYALGCDSAEVYCQHAAIIVTLRRGEEFCVQMGKVGEHGVNLRQSEAIKDTLRRVASGDLECSAAQTEFDDVPHTTPSYPIWLVCLCTGLACSAFGRLFGVDWPAFFPVLIGTASGQWIRHALIVRKQNIFIVSGIVSFGSAFLAGLGARLLRSSHPETATVAAVLLLVPGVAVLNIQMDAIEGKPNLAAARGLRVIYLLVFMTLGLIAAQRLILPVM